MDRFEIKAQELIRKCWAWDDFKKMKLIADALRTEYKNGEHKKRRTGFKPYENNE